MKKIYKIFIPFLLIISLTYASLSNRKTLLLEGYLRDFLTIIQKYLYYPVTYQKDNNIYYDKVSENLINELKKENQALEELLNISSSLTDFTHINATIVSRNTASYLNNLIIDKGSKSGIKDDLAVISSKGLIGKISHTSPNSSEVKLIINNDVNNKISVSINGVNALISGYDEKQELLYITGINNDANINQDDQVVTNGLGGIYPAGLYVGQVASITSDKYGVGKKIYVKTAEDFNNIKYIAVLKRNSYDN
jgi:rod shape-determining protein MreC